MQLSEIQINVISQKPSGWMFVGFIKNYLCNRRWVDLVLRINTDRIKVTGRSKIEQDREDIQLTMKIVWRS